MTIQKNFAILLVFLALCPTPLWAAPIPIANAGFEAEVLPCAGGPGCFAIDVVPSWNVSQGGTTFKPSIGAGGEYPGGIPQGLNVLAEGDPTVFGESSQDLGFAPSPNTTYTLTVYVGQRSDAPLTAYFVDLLVGTTVVASDSSLRPAPGQFLLDTVIFNSGASPGGQDLVIALGASGGGQANFDAVTLTASGGPSVPEPRSLFLVATALCLAAFFRRAKRLGS